MNTPVSQSEVGKTEDGDEFPTNEIPSEKNKV